MIHQIPELLDEAMLRDLRAFLDDAEFVDGRVTNANSKVKHNEQVPADAAAELGDRVVQALSLHPRLAALAFPKQILRPTFSRFIPGMAYGPHLDEALMAAGSAPIRTDLSCTIFLSDPGDYDGGELEIWLGHQRARLKEPAGHAVLYPTGVIHQVLPVTAGQRFAAVTWIQSFIDDATRRLTLNHLYRLAELTREKMNDEETLLLESVRTNLFRLWVDP